MNICFELSMPGVNAWNGKWSGEGRLYAKVVKFSDSKKAKEKTDKILEKGYYSYSFGDGWRAGVSARKVEGEEMRKIKKNTMGFMGYDWMIDDIRYCGR